MNDEVKKQTWDFEDEEKTFELVQEVRNWLYEGFYDSHGLGDEFSGGLEYVVKNLPDIQGLDHGSQVELVRMGYDQLAEDMGQFSHALRSIAQRGTTVLYGPARNFGKEE